MSTDLLSRPEALVAQWRSSATDNPAGPLFSTPFAEAELASAPSVETYRPTACTGANTIPCC
jgi:hypothetical protein